MSFPELKQAVDESSAEDRDLLAAYLHHLIRKDDPEFQKEMEVAAARSKTGETLSLAKVKDMHKTMADFGL